MSESDLSDLADDLLMIRFQAGDKDAFAALVQRYQGNVESYARKHLFGPLAAYADDLCQQVWLEFHEHRKRFDPTGQVRSLLYLIVERRCHNLVRDAQKPKRDYRRNVPLGNDVSDKTVNPAAEENRMYLDELLGKLPPDQAKVLRLVWLERHTAQSAANELGVSLNNVRWLLRQAMRRLRGDSAPGRDGPNAQ